jgi:hypothetical protein
MSRSGKSTSTAWKPWGDHPVIISIVVITAIISTIIGVLQYIDKSRSVEYTGRVVDNSTQAPISGAKIALDFQGAPPVVYTDSEGVFRFIISSSSNTLSGRIRIESDHYQSYNRNISLDLDSTRMEDIRLTPINQTAPTPPENLTPQSFPSAAQINDAETLPVNNWQITFTTNDAKADLSPIENGFCANVINDGSDIWDIEIASDLIILDSSTNYIMSFEAFAEHPRVIRVQVNHSGEELVDWSKQDIAI